MTTEQILEVSEQWVGDVRATAADVTVLVHGDQLFGGDVAMEKAEEVRALKAALTRVGLPPEAVSLTGLRAHVETGLFSRSSSAHYTLRVRVSDLSLLAVAFEQIVAAKQATLLDVRWIYEPGEEVVAGWIARCARRARHAATALAAALDAELDGVAFCRSINLGREQLAAEPTHVHHFTGAVPAASKRRSDGWLEASDLGPSTELAPSKRMGVRVELGFRLSRPA